LYRARARTARRKSIRDFVAKKWNKNISSLSRCQIANFANFLVQSLILRRRVLRRSSVMSPLLREREKLKCAEIQ
jgi:hypothetical protein